MSSKEITVNADGDVMAYDGKILEMFFLDGSKRFLAARLRYDKGEPDASGAVLLQVWATPAQMVGMIRVETAHIAQLDELLATIEASKKA